MIWGFWRKPKLERTLVQLASRVSTDTPEPYEQTVWRLRKFVAEILRPSIELAASFGRSSDYVFDRVFAAARKELIRIRAELETRR